MLRIVYPIGLDILYCSTSCIRDNIDYLGRVILKVILVNYKLIANLLGPVLNSNIAIYLVI